MPTLDEVRSDSTLRSELVVTSLKGDKPALLFILAVDQFKEKSRKLRAIAIFDTFIKNGGIWNEGLGEFDATRDAAHATVLNSLKARIDVFRETRRSASGMNFVKRWWTKGSRAVAFMTDFDRFIDSAKLKGEGISCQLTGLLIPLAHGSTAFEQPGWLQKAMAAKRKLKDAGFDVSRLGLTPIP